jgi:hypothetical protein
MAWHEFWQFSFAFNKYLGWEESVSEIFGWLSDGGVVGSQKSFRLAQLLMLQGCAREEAKVWLLKNSPLIYWGFGGGRADGRMHPPAERVLQIPRALGGISRRDPLQLTSGIGFRTRALHSWEVLASVSIGNYHEFYQVVPWLRHLSNYLLLS